MGLAVIVHPYMGHTSGETIMQPEATWAATHWYPNQSGIGIKGKLMHYNNDKAVRDKFLKETIGAIGAMADGSARMSMNFIELSELADKTWNAEHFDLGETGTNQQQN